MSDSGESTGLATEHYIIRGGAEGRDRLRVLSRVMRPSTDRFLARIAVPTGSVCLDAGCGGGEVARMLAARTGPTGRVVGIDVDPVSALTALVRAGRPGSTVAIEDVDFAGHFCHPEHPAFSRYCEVYAASAIGRGADPYIGRRLPSMFAAAGLIDIEVHVEQPAGFDPDVKAMAPLTMAAIGEAVVTAGLVTNEEVNGLVEQLWEFAEQPFSIMSVPRIVQVSGRVPFT